MMVTKQDDYQKHVHNVFDSGTYKIYVYSDVTYETEGEVRKTIIEKYSNVRECNYFQPETCDVEKNGKDMPMTFKLNICRSETGQEEDEQCNQKPTAIVLPTRHQTSTISEASSTTSVVLSEFVEGNTNELDESTVADTDGDTLVKTDENGDVHTVYSSSNMDPNTDNTFVKDIDRSSSILSCSIENNCTNVPSLQERDNRSFEELNTSSIVSNSSAGQEMLQETAGQETVQETAGQRMVQETAGQETVQETENVRNFNRNDSYSEDQKSRNENIKDAVTGIQMFDQTDVQHQDVQDSHLVHSNYTLYPPKSSHSPHSIRVVNPQEGNNASCHTKMFTKHDHEMKCSSIYDLPDSCITDMIATRLVQKIDHLESEIRKLSKLVFAMMSNLRFPGSVKKQDAVKPEFQENCKSYFNDDHIISLINGSSLQLASLLDNSVIHPECWEHNGHSSSACVCLASIASDLKSLQYNGLKQLPQTTNLCIIAEEKSCTCSYSNNKEEAVKTDTMLKVQKDSKRGEPANQPTSMLMVERPVLDTRAESDEIGHTFYLLTNQGEDNLDHNMDIKESMEGQAEQSSLVVEINKIKSSKSKENCNSSEKKKLGFMMQRNMNVVHYNLKIVKKKNRTIMKINQDACQKSACLSQ